MIGLFDSAFGSAWLLDDIKSIALEQHDPKRGTYRTIRFKTDRANYDAFSGEIELLFMRPVQMLPALPGCNIVSAWLGSDREPGQAIRSTLVAWALCFDGELRPVSARGVNDGGGLSAERWIEYPDGHVEAVGEFTDTPAAESADALIEELMGYRRARSHAAALALGSEVSDAR